MSAQERDKLITSEFHIPIDVLDALPDAIIAINLDQEIIYANNCAADIFGWSNDALLGRHINDLIPARLRDIHTQHVEQFLHGDAQALDMSSRAPLRGLKRDGVEFYLEGTILKTLTGDCKSLVIILRDITDRVIAAQKLKDALNEAATAIRMKSEILAMVSHELKTPLNAIIGFADMMKSELFGPLGQSRYRDYAQHINESGQHLLELVNALLISARVEAQRIHTNPSWLPLHDALDYIRTLMTPTLSKKNQSLGITVEDNISIHADAILFRHIVSNLISNAAKFTKCGGHISVRAATLRDRLTIDVIDTGCGIPADSIKKLGQPFVQAHMDTARNVDGIGLGLYIVRSYLELHGAALSISSVEGDGTTMRTCWPQWRVEHDNSSITPPEHGQPPDACHACFSQHPLRHCSRFIHDNSSGAIRLSDRAEVTSLSA